MTNYIEELMKAAGVEKQYYSFKSADGNTYNWELNENGNEKHKKHFIGEPALKERIFTPAKQLELIKLILKAGDIDNIHQYYYEISKMFVFECRSLPELGTYNQWSTQNVNYESALAELALILINENELDKSEVKRMLEDDN